MEAARPRQSSKQPRHDAFSRATTEISGPLPTQFAQQRSNQPPPKSYSATGESYCGFND